MPLDDPEEFLDFDSDIRSAQTANVLALDADPDQAARALELGNATGVPSTAIYGDLDGFERQNKAALGSAVIGDNLHIADYLNSHTMAARVSHDDLGQLDAASQSITALGQPSALHRLHQMLDPSNLVAPAASSFAQGFGAEP